MSQASYKQAWFIWSIGISFAIFQFTQQMAAGVMTNAWIQDFKTDALGLSYLSSIFYYGYLIFQIPAGLLFDRYGPRRVLTVAAIVLCLGCLLLAAATDFYVALLARFIMGCGATFSFVGLLCLVSEWFPSRRFAFFVSLSETSAMVVTSFTVILFAWIVSHSNWRFTMLLSGVIAALLSGAIFFFTKDKPDDQTNFGLSKKGMAEQLKIVFGNKDVWLCGLFGFFAFSFLTSFASLWGEPFLIKNHQMSLHQATTAASMTLIGIAIGGPAVSFISSKLQKRKPIMWSSMAIAFLGSLLLVMGKDLSTLSIFILVLLCGVMCSSYMLAFALAKEVTPRSVRGTAMAAVNLITMSSAIFLQPLIGWLIETNMFGLSPDKATSYRLALLTLPIGCIIAMCLVFKMRETECKGLDD